MSDDILPSSDNKPSSWVTWRFNIEDPEGERRLHECLDAPDVKSAIREYDNELRRRSKYGEPDAQLMTVDQARGLLWASLERYGVDLGDD